MPEIFIRLNGKAPTCCEMMLTARQTAESERSVSAETREPDLPGITKSPVPCRGPAVLAVLPVREFHAALIFCRIVACLRDTILCQRDKATMLQATLRTLRVTIFLRAMGPDMSRFFQASDSEGGTLGNGVRDAHDHAPAVPFCGNVGGCRIFYRSFYSYSMHHSPNRKRPVSGHPTINVCIARPVE